MKITASKIPDIVSDQRCRAARHGQFDQVVVSLIREIWPPEEKDRRPVANTQERIEQFIPFAT